MAPEYMPHMKDTNGNVWTLLSMNFCIDFGGRACQMEFQTEVDGQFKTKSFVIYWKSKEFVQWDSSEFADCTPVKGLLFQKVIEMFDAFDLAATKEPK